MTKQLTPKDLIGICEAEYVESPEGMITIAGSWEAMIETLKYYKRIQIKADPDDFVQKFMTVPFYLRYKPLKLRSSPASDNG